MTDRLIITLSKTANGMHDYIQIISEDMMSVNVILIAEKIEIKDQRITEPTKPKKGFFVLFVGIKKTIRGSVCAGGIISGIKNFWIKIEK